MSFAPAERVADAVLYEGYLLYPYRASAAKNRVRWQFGVVAPAAYVREDDSEHAWMQTECIVAGAERATLDVRLRFLHPQARRVEVPAGDGTFEPVDAVRVGDRELITWDEGVPFALDVTGIPVADLLGGERVEPVIAAPARACEEVRDDRGAVRARVVLEQWPITASLVLSAAKAGSWYTLRVRLDNLTPWPAGEPRTRDRALRRSCIGAHLLLSLDAGAFVSLTDPPPAAAAAVRACRNQHLWPVLAGPPGCASLLLASPIILSDHPAVAPESPGDLCDATEIDEILTLRVMTLTDEEKREASATDPRARRIVEQSDTLPPELFERLHGAIRSLRTIEAPPSDFETLVNPPGEAPPELASVDVGAVTVARGSHVRLRPSRRADSMDMFLRDRAATVAGVYRDLEGRVYVAVTVDDDPAAELRGGTGRFFYFFPDEIEPLEAAGGASSARVT